MIFQISTLTNEALSKNLSSVLSNIADVTVVNEDMPASEFLSDAEVTIVSCSLKRVANILETSNINISEENAEVIEN